MPEKAKVLVRKGSSVILGEVLANFVEVEILRFSCPVWVRSRIEELRRLVGKKVVKGEVFYEVGGIGGGKLILPESGKFGGIDEFGNLILEIEGKKKRELLSPVTAKVAKIEDGEIALEFEALEFRGEGITGDKVWGRGEFGPITKLTDLDWKFKDKIIFVKEVGVAMLNKAEVVEVAGMVVLAKSGGELEGIEIDFPVLGLDEDEFEGVGRVLKEEGQMLLDAGGGRLLVL